MAYSWRILEIGAIGSKPNKSIFKKSNFNLGQRKNPIFFKSEQDFNGTLSGISNIMIRSPECSYARSKR